MSLQSGSICVLLCAQSVPGEMEMCAPKLQVGVCTFQRVVLHSLVLQCALSHCHHARSPCLSGAERCQGHQDQVCVVCACLGLSTLEHEPVGLGMCRAGKDGILLEHWLKQGTVSTHLKVWDILIDSREICLPQKLLIY